MLAPRKKLWSTPIEVVEAALDLLQPCTEDKIYDLGRYLDLLLFGSFYVFITSLTNQLYFPLLITGAGDGRFVLQCRKLANCK